MKVAHTVVVGDKPVGRTGAGTAVDTAVDIAEVVDTAVETAVEVAEVVGTVVEPGIEVAVVAEGMLGIAVVGDESVVVGTVQRKSGEPRKQ